MRIPEETISRVSAAVDIVAVISESVRLKRSGMNYFGLCPFHSEKTPSFSVSPQKQIFYCFGCGAGGTVFTYLMKYHGISFPEAVKMIAKKVGIPIETGPVSPEQQRRMVLREGLYRLNRQVQAHYEKLLTSAPAGGPGRDYLKRRGITEADMVRFNLGFAPNRWDEMVIFLRKQRVTRAMAEASGLVLKRRNRSGYYDRFVNRIIFPIFDVTMQVAGFGGRILDNNVPPKYLNSPETPVYSKSRILYGFHLSRSHCRKEDAVYIVEGYFDFISLFQAGVKNCVATLGTALTEFHVRLLKGASSRAFLVFDSDAAGISAAGRSISTFIKEGVDVRIVILPTGQDPDSFIREKGRAAFEAVAEKAMPVIPFLTRTAMDRHGLSVSGKIKILDEMKVHLAGIEDVAARSLYIHEFSQKLGIDESAVLEKVKQAFVASQHSGASSADRGTAVTGGQAAHDGASRREAQMISMMFHYPPIRQEIDKRGVLDCFYTPALKTIGKCVLETAGEEQQAVQQVMAALETDELRRLAASLAMVEIPETDNLHEKSIFLMNRIIKVWNRTENRLTEKIKTAEQGSDSERSFDLLARRQKEIRKLRGYE